MIAVENLCVRIGTFALERISFAIPSGEYAVLMGRTGTGKTTLLEAICGLRTVSSGQIRLGSIDVTHKKPAQRGIGFVPQDGALFPTMAVGDQLAFALVLRKWSLRAIDERVNELADLLGIEHILHRTPDGLSGGEKQRVALGRALAARPAILCMDEPLSALDEETREEMRHLLKEVQRHAGVTTLHVTHSREEADLLADQVLEVKDRRVTQWPASRRCMRNADHNAEHPALRDATPRAATGGERAPR